MDDLSPQHGPGPGQARSSNRAPQDPDRLPDSSEELAVWADATQDLSAMKAKIQAHYRTPATG